MLFLSVYWVLQWIRNKPVLYYCFYNYFDILSRDTNNSYIFWFLMSHILCHCLNPISPLNILDSGYGDWLRYFILQHWYNLTVSTLLFHFLVSLQTFPCYYLFHKILCALYLYLSFHVICFFSIQIIPS